MLRGFTAQVKVWWYVGGIEGLLKSVRHCWFVVVGCVDQTGQEALMHMCECFALHANRQVETDVTQERRLAIHETKPMAA
jgi:hypothetical protein